MNQHRTSVWKRAFFWLSSAGTETLEQCPNWEQRKYVAFGATVLVPCLFAFIACAYAISTLTDNHWAIYGVAAVWAFIIMTIDRALLASYRAFMSPIKKLGQFMLRLVVAGLMGITIAHPLVLLLFKDTVTSVIEQERSAEIVELKDRFKIERDAAQALIRNQEDAIAKQRDRWNETFQAKFLVQQTDDGNVPIPGLTADQQEQLNAAVTDATKPYQDRLDALDTEMAKLSTDYTKIQGEQAFWQEEFEKEVNGQRSGLVGLGPRAKSIRDDQLAWRRTEATRLGNQLTQLTEERSGLLESIGAAKAGAIASFESQLELLKAKRAEEEQRLSVLRSKVDADQAEQFVTQQNALRETIKQQIDSMLGELERMQESAATIAEEEQATVSSIANEPRRDILTQTLALHDLFERGEEGGEFAFWTYCILTLLFMLVDTIPLMVKFFCSAGPYDKLVDRDEVRYDAEHRAFLQSHGKYMRHLSEGNLISVTRNKNLEDAMVDGVEHSRAAQTFLDSLIEMERAFNEKMRQEEERVSVHGGDQSDMLAMMKKRFYDDMHQRMENFFGGDRRATDLR